VEKFPSIQGNLGRKISKHRRPYYPVSKNEIAPPRSIDGNPTFNLEQCSAKKSPACALSRPQVQLHPGTSHPPSDAAHIFTILKMLTTLKNKPCVNI
jgi:hypothetical protein